MKLLERYKAEFKKKKDTVMSFEEYLGAAKKDSSYYLSPAERILKAIGKPKIVDTAKNPKLSRIFGNRVIKQYDAFNEFYGLEDVIERIVSFFKHAAQGLEESRQILYLLGPVGSAKSSIAVKIKNLMEHEPIYVLADELGVPSPLNDSPCCMLNVDHSEILGIPPGYLKICPSPWALKRLEEYEGDLSRFKVLKRYPSGDKQLAISKTEPGDENNQDISALVGKFDIRQLEFFPQDDPDAYRYSGGLCLSNQGILEFVEMFKAPIKVLHPLLTATQEREYKATEALSPLPFDGIILAHSNESEWIAFKNNKQNEAFLDRVFIVEVPYCLRVDDEVEIYKKLLRTSQLENAPIAPRTLKYLAEFAVLSRLEPVSQSDIVVKLRVYNGEDVKEKNNSALSYQTYKDMSSKDEGFSGVSTRLAFKVLSEVFNFDAEEIAANPVHLFYVLEKTIARERLDQATEDLYLTFLKQYMQPHYIEKVGQDIQTAYLDSYDGYGQSLFDRYIVRADHWVQDNDYRNPDTGHLSDREELNNELEKIEKPARIANPKDFRNEVVTFALRYQAKHQGENPDWKAYEKLKRVIEKTLFSKTEDLLPVISFSGSGGTEEKKKHEAFLSRMQKLGYTKRQVALLAEWHMRASKS